MTHPADQLEMPAGTAWTAGLTGETFTADQLRAERRKAWGAAMALQAIPTGWRLVPIEPTDAIWQAWRACCTTGDPEAGMAEFTYFRGDWGNWAYAWGRMVDAAPNSTHQSTACATIAGGEWGSAVPDPARSALAELLRLKDVRAEFEKSERPGMHWTQEEIDAWSRQRADLRDNEPKAWAAARAALAAAPAVGVRAEAVTPSASASSGPEAS